MSYLVEVTDPPTHPLERPLRFRLGPFTSREEAERMAQRAQETNSRTETRIVEHPTMAVR
jgi:hypothetical protein